MYDLNTHSLCRVARSLAALMTTAILLSGGDCLAQALSSGSVVRRIDGAQDKLELTTNTSRILTLDKKIPKVQVNNPELLSVTPLSATEVQVSARKAGVTQVNLWDEDGQIHTVDVYIYGDVRELEHALATQFPNSAIRVYRYSQSLVLTGFIDRPDYVDPIRQLAEDYAPKVINNIAVGGVQQVLLKVKLYEVSRTKLRRLGVDLGQVSSSGAYFFTNVSGLLTNLNPDNGVTEIIDSGGQTVEALFTDGGDAFLTYLDALRENNVAKILAEPNIVAVSGRPAQFNEGGEIPVLVPQSLGNIGIEYRPYGTQVDFLPIVLGNGKIRLEVRPRVSDLDYTNAVILNDIQVPALSVRQVDTAVEMNAGQTFAIAGLIQQRSRTVNRGIPLLADVPILGVPFRKTEDEVEEIELLILVTPELVDPMSPHEVPLCGPGMGTTTPTDSELYCEGAVEKPDFCGPCASGACQGGCQSGCADGECGNGNCPQCISGGFPGPPRQMLNGAGVDPTMTPVYVAPAGESIIQPMMTPAPATPMNPAPPKAEQMPAPADGASSAKGPELGLPPAPSEPQASTARHYGPSSSAELVRGSARPYQAEPAKFNSAGLIGPIGYDDE